MTDIKTLVSVKALEAALRCVEAEIQRVEKSPDSEWGSDYYGDASVPGGTFSWSKKDEELHYLRRDAETIRSSLSPSREAGEANQALYTALVAMRVASGLPSVSREYDFSDAISEVETAIRSRMANPIMTVIDPDQWEPCTPEYLLAGGSCQSVRVWNDATGNHWHPKLSAFVCHPVTTTPASSSEVSTLKAEVERMRKALADLVACHDEFNASSGNMEEAYYKLAKYAYPKWQAARAALHEVEEG